MQTASSAIVRLVLHNFRSYPYISLRCEPASVILVGANGAGKTNILEALSLFNPGRGLRSMALNEASHRISNNQDAFPTPWTVSATYIGIDQGYLIGTSLKRIENREKRIIQINGELLKNQAQLSDFLNILWWVPRMEGLLAEGASTRRRFLDRMVYGFNSYHATHLNRYEHLMRERFSLLYFSNPDLNWLKAIEQKMAAEAIAIAAARKWLVEQLQQPGLHQQKIFPQVVLHLEGLAEDLLQQYKALEAEEIFCQKLCEMRSCDKQEGYTTQGVHRTDLKITYVAKDMEAQYCSTGEQKAILLGMMIANARLQTKLNGRLPILLLDEITAHLDISLRRAIFEEIINLNMQAWLTGTDIRNFDLFTKYAQCFYISNNTIKPL